MKRKVGYARDSTDPEHLAVQIEALALAGCEVIYQDAGSNTARLELEKCLKALKEGDVLVVWSLGRLAASLSDLIGMVNDLHKKKIGLQSITDKIDTTMATGESMHVFKALSSFERERLGERTKAGLKTARARGRMGGRPPKLTISQVNEIRRLVKNPETPIKQIAETYQVSRATIYKVAENAAPYNTDK